MMPNVFLVNPVFNEDELTAYWHHTLAVVPGLGQAFIDDDLCRTQHALFLTLGIGHALGRGVPGMASSAPRNGLRGRPCRSRVSITSF